MSAILPGAGHFLIQRRRNGLLLVLAFLLLPLLFRPLGLPRTVGGLGFSGLAFIGLAIVAMVDAGYSGPRETRARQVWLALLLPIALLAGIIHANWALRVSGFRPYAVMGGSMAPAIPEGTRIMVDAFYYRKQSPKRGDIVACLLPTNARLIVIKRVIAVGGETIEIRDGKVRVNGTAIEEPYLSSKEPMTGEFDRLRPTPLPTGKLFVMGDARELSFDSRMRNFGLVDVTSVRGRVIYSVSMSGPIKTFN
jgi:signal peptidase I